VQSLFRVDPAGTVGAGRPTLRLMSALRAIRGHFAGNSTGANGE
jgi:hypothetical protein